jgi:hypothetical protein
MFYCRAGKAKLSPSNQAKAHGARSLKYVSEFSGYNLDTLRRYSREKPCRFRALCVASVCHELGVSGDWVRAMQLAVGK